MSRIPRIPTWMFKVESPTPKELLLALRRVDCKVCYVCKGFGGGYRFYTLILSLLPISFKIIALTVLLSGTLSCSDLIPSSPLCTWQNLHHCRPLWELTGGEVCFLNTHQIYWCCHFLKIVLYTSDSATVHNLFEDLYNSKTWKWGNVFECF